MRPNSVVCETRLIPACLIHSSHLNLPTQCLHINSLSIEPLHHLLGTSVIMRCIPDVMQLQLKGGRYEGIIGKDDIRETRTPTIGLETSLMTLCTYVL